MEMAGSKWMAENGRQKTSQKTYLCAVFINFGLWDLVYTSYKRRKKPYGHLFVGQCERYIFRFLVCFKNASRFVVGFRKRTKIISPLLETLVEELFADNFGQH